MHSVTFYNVGDADTCLIETTSSKMILFDFADYHDATNPDEKRVALATALRDKLGSAGRTAFDVVAFTHADDDHIHGASRFFSLTHAHAYQGEGRIGIGELWVPAAFIVESSDALCAEARIIQAEAQHRLVRGVGIRVFSRPAALRGWLADCGVALEDRVALVSDAGQVVPTFSLATDEIEFFPHSPWATQIGPDLIVDRNRSALVLQVTFAASGSYTRLLMTADVTYEVLAQMTSVTRAHGNDERLKWDVVKVPHHCSRYSVGAIDSSGTLIADDSVDWLFSQGNQRGILVSSSRPFPANDYDVQPPHRDAAAFYRRKAVAIGSGRFIATMAHPLSSRPTPLVVTIDAFGAKPNLPDTGGSATIVSMPAPRAG